MGNWLWEDLVHALQYLFQLNLSLSTIQNNLSDDAKCNVMDGYSQYIDEEAGQDVQDIYVYSLDNANIHSPKMLSQM